MEHYVVSARKYRPATFSTVIGQKPLTAALRHAIATNQLAHAYLFCGSRGVGKTSCARIFAKTINCEHRTSDGEACNECDSCRAFNEGRSMNIIELDAASNNSVDDIRALIQQVVMPPTQGRYRVFIVDEVHMLSQQAFNAFLKTLEEPPSHAIFILATTEKHKIIPTILSRCQIFDFSRITIQDMVDHLKMVAANEGIKADEAALGLIARKADGAMRDALSIFDQVAASTMGDVSYSKTIDNLNMLDSEVYVRLVNAFLTNNVADALLIYKEVRERGFDAQFFINGLGQFLRDLMVAQNPQTITLLEAGDDVRRQMAELAEKCPPQFLYKAMSLCNDADLNFRIATNKQFLIELTLVKLCQPYSPSPDDSGSEEGLLLPLAASQTPAPPSREEPSATAPAPVATQQLQPAQTAAAPAAPPLTKAPAAAAPRLRVGSALSIHRQPSAEQPEAAPMEAARRNAPYGPEAIDHFWNAYIAAHKAETILVQTMGLARPEKIDGDMFRITVDSSLQVNIVNEFRDDILSFIRNGIQNDLFDLTVVVREGESSPITWTQKQVYDHMLAKQPALADLMSKFSATLG